MSNHPQSGPAQQCSQCRNLESPSVEKNSGFNEAAISRSCFICTRFSSIVSTATELMDSHHQS